MGGHTPANQVVRKTRLNSTELDGMITIDTIFIVAWMISRTMTYHNIHTHTYLGVRNRMGNGDGIDCEWQGEWE
jgi:hypothetical protein